MFKYSINDNNYLELMQISIACILGEFVSLSKFSKFIMALFR